MADGSITVEVRFPSETLDAVKLIAKTAGVAPASVIKVAMALQLLNLQRQQAADDEAERQKA